MPQLVKYAASLLEPRIENAFPLFLVTLLAYYLYSLYAENRLNRLNNDKNIRRKAEEERRKIYLEKQKRLSNSNSNSNSNSSSSNSNSGDNSKKAPTPGAEPTQSVTRKYVLPRANPTSFNGGRSRIRTMGDLGCGPVSLNSRENSGGMRGGG